MEERFYNGGEKLYCYTRKSRGIGPFRLVYPDGETYYGVLKKNEYFREHSGFGMLRHTNNCILYGEFKKSRAYCNGIVVDIKGEVLGMGIFVKSLLKLSGKNLD